MLPVSGRFTHLLREHYPSFIVPTGSCAPPLSSHGLRCYPYTVHLGRLPRAPAAQWWFPTLSPRVFPWMLGPLSRWVFWCTCPVLPSRHRPSPRGCEQVGFPPHPAKRLHSGRDFRDDGHSTICSGLQVCLPPRSLPPQQLMLLGGRGVYIRAECMSLPSYTSDMLAV